MDNLATMKLKPGREKSLLRRHPWIFSGAIAAVSGSPGEGETIKIIDADGNFLAWGAFSPRSQITGRVWSWKEADMIGPALFQQRLQSAIALRDHRITSAETNAIRLVHGESDGLPGLIVDRYADILVVQFLSSGPERWRQDFIRLLIELTGVHQVYERSDVDVRQLEGLELRSGPLVGSPERVIIEENGLHFYVDVHHGHKTGFYLDQRNNRLRLRNLTAGKQVMDCFSYTGGFTINALAGAAEKVLSVDASIETLQMGRANLTLNGFDANRVEWLNGDVFQVLRTQRDRGRSFDVIILDPPKFAPTAAQVPGAARGYKDINRLAFKLLKPEGLLLTFSCSGGLSAELFQKIVADAALDAGVEAQIIEHLFQAPDHPIALNFPEGAYLKGFVVRVH
jgi:23S rRNA (cytosine1962-C5)-methyltransferase